MDKQDMRASAMSAVIILSALCAVLFLVALGGASNGLPAAWPRTPLAYGVVVAAFLLFVFWLCRLALLELRSRHALMLALADSEAGMRAAQQLASIGNWRFNLDTQISQWSEEMYRVMGRDSSAALPSFEAFIELFHPDDRMPLRELAEQGTGWSGELRTNPANGPMRYLDARCSILADGDGTPTALMGTLQDVTDQRRAKEKLRLLGRVFESTRDSIVVADADHLIIAVNPAFERITGYTEAEVLHKSPLLMHAEPMDNTSIALLRDSLLADGQWRGEVQGRRKNGQVFPEWMSLSAIHDEHGRVDGHVGVFSDLSEIRRATDQLAFLNHHDPLTLLPNRSLLKDRLHQAIEAARPAQRKLAVLLLNVDRLKRVNEVIGHDAGDQVLHDIGLRLLDRLQPGDTLARLGSDEFVLLLTHVEDTADINAAARQMLDLVAQPAHVCGHDLTVTGSIGIALYPDDGVKPADLIRNADTALADVKSSGRNSFRYFKEKMNICAQHWMSMEHSLRGALERGELQLYYQPQMALCSDHLSGCEALLRWNSNTLGDVPPVEFIPLAEDTGLIVPIGEWVLRTACLQGKAWQDAGLPAIRIAVNVSAHQVTVGNVPDLVRDALERSGLAPHCLAIELTESVLMKESEMVTRQVAELRDMGVAVALDDFGTGYSSLSYLSRFALDKIKLDQSLVRNLSRESKSDAIVRAAVGLAHGLGLTVVAEGVETHGQLEFLRDACCDEIQGFLFSKPIPASELANSLADSAV